MEPVSRKLPPGELNRRAELARESSRDCHFCPRECGVDRTADEPGICGIGATVKVSSANLHQGEEPPITGVRGSGTIFFSGCNLRCDFCQNYPISQLRNGMEMSHAGLADAMLGLQARGAHNINLVTPSHVTWHFLEAMALAVQRGLRLPIVYNSSGYEGQPALRLLDGVVDVYMPDLKYADDEQAELLSDAKDYWRVATSALKEMLRQVGHLTLDDQGIAERGLLVRHLVLPGGRAGTDRVVSFIAEQLGTETHMSFMRQYFPANRAPNLPGMDRRVDDAEWFKALEALERAGLQNGWVQGED